MILQPALVFRIKAAGDFDHGPFPYQKDFDSTAASARPSYASYVLLTPPFGNREDVEASRNGDLRAQFNSSAEHLGLHADFPLMDRIRRTDMFKLGEGITIDFARGIPYHFFYAGDDRQGIVLYETKPLEHPEICAFYEGMSKRKDLMRQVGEAYLNFNRKK